MNLQERVAGSLNPAEEVILYIRRSPRAVRIEWPTGPNMGREVIYAANANGGLMHIHMPNSLIPQMKLAPNSPLATRNSRHPITEAGFDTIIDDMTLASQRQLGGDSSLGRIRYAGMVTPEGQERPCHEITRVTPKKEKWVVHLDPESYLPLLVRATAENGDLLEQYTFSDVAFDLPELAAAEAFDPVARWGPPKGLFQRLARSGDPTTTEPVSH